MDKYNLTIFQKVGRILPSIALASTLVSMPSVANADEIDEETPSTLETFSTPSETKTETFDTLEAAEAYIDELEQGSNTLKVIETELTIKQELEGAITKNIEEEFDTKEKAENRLDELETEHELTSSNIETIKVGTGEIISAKKYDSNSYYEVGDNTFLIIKQGNGTIAIWTEDELTLEEQQRLLNSYLDYNSKNNVDGSTQNGQFDKAEFISGLGEKDLSYLGNGNNWGTYTFVEQNGQIIMTCDKDRISHSVIGFDDRKISYKLTASYSENKYKDVYEVAVEITNKEEQTREIEQTEISYKIFEITYNSKYTIEGTISIPNDDYLLKISGDKEKELEPEPEPELTEEVTDNGTVKTGDEMPNPVPSLAALGLGAIAIGKGKQKTLGKYPKKHN